MNLVVLILGKAGGKEVLTQTLRDGSVGDVRQLATLLEQLADLDVTTDAGATVSTAPAAELPSEGLDLKAHMERIEVNLIRQALQRADGVVAHAANTLGLRRTTLVEKLRKYGLGREGVNGTEPSQPAAH